MKPKILLSLAFMLPMVSCIMIETDPGPVFSGFQSPEEFIENPYVSEAIEGSEIEIYYGDNPPSLAGKYNTNGEITKHHPGLIAAFPSVISSTFCLYNQTLETIDFTESAGDLTIGGEGNYITGDNGMFTIWGESLQTGSVAGLPGDCTATVVFIMSGRKLDNGDLYAKGLTVTTELKDCQGFIGGWYMWEADFDYDGNCSGPEQ